MIFHTHHLGPQREHLHDGQYYLSGVCTDCQALVLSPYPIATVAQRARLDAERKRQLEVLGTRALAYPANVRDACEAVERVEETARERAKRVVVERFAR